MRCGFMLPPPRWTAGRVATIKRVSFVQDEHTLRLDRIEGDMTVQTTGALNVIANALNLN
jgi:hypothetical protein